MVTVDRLIEELAAQLQQETNTNPQICHQVAKRLMEEVQRICQESPHIQTSGEIDAWGRTLMEHRRKQCLRYYQLGSRQGRGELQSLLSAIVYQYLKPPGQPSSYQQRLLLIEDFLQGFYLEALNAFRRETQLDGGYQPRSRLELAEYMAFCERYAKRRIRLPQQRSQQLIILRAQAFTRRTPLEWITDLEAATEPTDTNPDRPDPVIRQIRAALRQAETPAAEHSLHDTIVKTLIQYLQQQGRQDCVDYFILRLQDLPTAEIEAILKLTPRQRDYLQQRFKYHLIRFALSHQWELVHDWLEADLEHNLGLTAGEWQRFKQRLEPGQQQLLTLKQRGQSWAAIAKTLTWTPTKTRKQWFRLLEIAWEIRNRSVS
ncbi:MAG: hypothetical protein F6J87_17975 [Spirulina sp. SIO3F2]|nr:hypothetical protein [Spirulina sp. SIO3F2]